MLGRQYDTVVGRASCEVMFTPVFVPGRFVWETISFAVYIRLVTYDQKRQFRNCDFSSIQYYVTIFLFGLLKVRLWYWYLYRFYYSNFWFLVGYKLGQFWTKVFGVNQRDSITTVWLHIMNHHKIDKPRTHNDSAYINEHFNIKTYS